MEYLSNMNERSELMAYVRGEIVGPSRSMLPADIVEIKDGHLSDPKPGRRGSLLWRSSEDQSPEEVLYYDRESPHRKYGAGLLHPDAPDSVIRPEQQAALATDTTGIDDAPLDDDPRQDEDEIADDDPPTEAVASGSRVSAENPDLDFDVTSPDVRRPSTMAISLCARIEKNGSVVVRLPRQRLFSWQADGDHPFPVNGRYEIVHRTEQLEGGGTRGADVWRRVPVVPSDCTIIFSEHELSSGAPVLKNVPGLDARGPILQIEAFSRAVGESTAHFLITIALRNRKTTASKKEAHEATLYQSYFEVAVEGGEIVRYPESRRAFHDLDSDEQSLSLLYRDSATWAIGHGCAAGWDSAPGKVPESVYADVMPAVELPSMTPDIRDSAGKVISLRMRDLAALSDDGIGPVWDALELLANEYEDWISRRRAEVDTLDEHLVDVADRHMALCDESLRRIRTGIELLRSDTNIRCAFRLANVSMLLQQIATKELRRRSARWDRVRQCPVPAAQGRYPWQVFEAGEEGSRTGNWRAFQLAFLLMQLEGAASEKSTDRGIVDLIWFPTGGGKTEAYLGVMSFLLWHQRLLMKQGTAGPPRDGTNVLMRYTLRMLTTQQFQRAASLICAMEVLRRNPSRFPGAEVPGQRFALGLWIGGDGTPNKIEDAKRAVNAFKKGESEGNPLVLTECPWCRTEIGRCEAGKARKFELVGIAVTADGPMLRCVDSACEFGQMRQQHWLPVEVIDERIYKVVPSIVIATADKFAMMAYRPQAGILLGRCFEDGSPVVRFHPPSLIVQDELHLISGPLGTMYGLYEAVIEGLCSMGEGEDRVVPKIIASTATIRGAAAQTLALYGRVRQHDMQSNVFLFPSPGLTMGDSFFGVYARSENGSLDHGRLYLGIHASNYGSVLTAQVRVFASLLCRPAMFAESAEARDPWWTLLGFYNSIRELGGARTLFDADIRSRLKFLQNREGVEVPKRRSRLVVEELTSRLLQSEIVGMMDRLSVTYGEDTPAPIDACLASSIIEVGVDIDRLSLMGVIGQPKSTAQYIQVTGRVGRRWDTRPGLIVTLFNPGKSRDRSHFEQFHSYHRRLYERVEPTSATPFALSALQRAAPGALILWARQHVEASASSVESHKPAVLAAAAFLAERCRLIQHEANAERSIDEIRRVCDALLEKWSRNPARFEAFPPDPNEDYLMLWPGQFASVKQKRNGVEVPSSMRSVDRSGALTVTDGYASEL
jgi:hypothetical protein